MKIFIIAATLPVLPPAFAWFKTRRIGTVWSAFAGVAAGLAVYYLAWPR